MNFDDLSDDEIYSILKKIIPDYETIRHFCTSSKRVNNVCKRSNLDKGINENYVNYLVGIDPYTERYRNRDFYLKTNLTDRTFRLTNRGTGTQLIEQLIFQPFYKTLLNFETGYIDTLHPDPSDLEHVVPGRFNDKNQKLRAALLKLLNDGIILIT